jgi:hypothetical protein
VRLAWAVPPQETLMTGRKAGDDTLVRLNGHILRTREAEKLARFNL